MTDGDNKPSGFKVTDRRVFDAQGDPRTTAPEPESTNVPTEKKTLPPADFSTLVISLGSSAMMCLHPGKAEPDKPNPVDLPMAKHAIDLLSILEEKTKGNLTPEEDQLLEGLLFDLRLSYVEAIKKP
jgi:hypothetical protein